MYVIKLYSTGEIWEIEDHNMKVKGGYYYRMVLAELKWSVHHSDGSLSEDQQWAEILYRDEYGIDRHIASIYYHVAETYMMIAWYNWHDEQPYQHSCFKFVHR